jgi:hypothetical protein
MMKETNSDGSGGLGLSDEEKKQLLENAKAIDAAIESLDNDGDE